MTHHEVEELLGAYALDAVDADEAREIEAHLATCARCRAEVASHREVAALLTSGTSVPPPAGVWDKIAADLGDSPPPVPIEVALARREAKAGPPPRRNLLVGLSVAAAVVLIALMGAVLVNQRNDLDDLQEEVAQSRAVGELAADPTTEVVELDGEGGGARAFVGEDGRSVLVADLPELDADETYQLWGLPAGGDQMVSLGLLGGSPEETEFRVEGGIATLAITTEPSGGSPEPTSDPLAVGQIA